MKEKDNLRKIFGIATLWLIPCFVLALTYYIADLLDYNLKGIAMYLYLVVLVMIVISTVMFGKKWLQIFYVLKPRLLKMTIYMWHLFIFLITRTIIINCVISIIYTYYSINRCKELKLKGMDIVDETNKILKDNNNALYMSAVFFLWYEIKTTSLVNGAMIMTGLNYTWSLVICILAMIVVTFGFVRFQYVICLNLLDKKMK